jgi:hypothetical protein
MHISMEKHLENCNRLKGRDKTLGEVLDFYNESITVLFLQVREIIDFLEQDKNQPTEGKINVQ